MPWWENETTLILPLQDGTNIRCSGVGPLISLKYGFPGQECNENIAFVGSSKIWK